MMKRLLLPDAFYRWRDRLLTDPEFQRRAAANPFTRFVARRRARALFNLCAGFIYSQVVAACVRLGLLAELERSVGDTHRSLISTNQGCGASTRLPWVSCGSTATRTVRGTAPM